MTTPGVTRNFLYNLSGSAVPIASALITVPLYLSEIGTARYGVVAITWILLGYFGFLDFGLSRASANALSKLGHASSSQRAPVLVTAFCLNVGLGLVGGLILYAGANLLLFHAFRIPPDLLPELRPAVPWIAAMLPLGMVAGVAGGALDSRERFLLGSLLSSFGTVLGQVLPLICAYLIGPSLAIIVPAILLSRLLSVSIGYAVVLRIEWPVRLSDFDRRWVRRLFGYGAWVSVSSIVSPILESFDQMLIGVMLGASAIAHYAVPMNLTMRSQIIATALARTLFPRLSRLPPAEAKAVAEDAIVTLAYGFGAIIAGAILLSGPFLRLWVGAPIARVSTPVAEILLFGAWANGLAFLPYTLLQGQGRPDQTAKAHLIEIVPFLGGLSLLMHWFGLPGAALAWTLRTVGDGVLLTWMARVSGRLVRRMAVPTLFLLAALALSLSETGTVSLVVSGVVLGSLMLGSGLLLDPAMTAFGGNLMRRVGGRFHRNVKPVTM